MSFDAYGSLQRDTATVLIFDIFYLQLIYLVLGRKGLSDQRLIDESRAFRIIIKTAYTSPTEPTELATINDTQKSGEHAKNGTEDRSHECIATSSGKRSLPVNY